MARARRKTQKGREKHERDTSRSISDECAHGFRVISRAMRKFSTCALKRHHLTILLLAFEKTSKIASQYNYFSFFSSEFAVLHIVL